MNEKNNAREMSEEQDMTSVSNDANNTSLEKQLFTGPPVYFYDGKRGISDPVSDNEYQLEPACPATRKLWLCLESLRSLENLLVGSRLLDSKEKKRRLIQVLTPFVSFCDALVNFCNYIETPPKEDSDFTKPTKEKRLNLIDHKKRFIDNVSYRTGPIRFVRDKISAHVDKKLSNHEAKKVIKDVNNHQLGLWIEASFILLYDILCLDIFSWVVQSDRNDIIKLMNVSGSLVTFRTDPETGKVLPGMVEIEIMHKPDIEIAEIADNILKEIDWMFPKGSLRLHLLKKKSDRIDLPSTQMTIKIVNDASRDAALIALHEAGHACFSFDILGSKDFQIFKEISIDERESEHEETPKYIELANSLFESLSFIDQSAILLAGWYAQEGNNQDINSWDDFRVKVMSKLEYKNNCTEDVRKVLAIEAIEANKFISFWENIYNRVIYLWSKTHQKIAPVADSLVDKKSLSWTDFLEIIEES